MTRAIVEALLKVYGLTIIVSGIFWLGQIPFIAWSGVPEYRGQRAMVASTIVLSAVSVMAGGLLIKFAPPIAARLAREDVPAEVLPSLPRLIEAGLILLGIYYLIEGVAEAAPAAADAVTDLRNVFVDGFDVQSMHLQRLPGAALYVAGGLFLIFKREWIVTKLNLVPRA